jgi:hypothetical protein
MNRRFLLLSVSAIVPAAFLAGCGAFTSNTVNGVTTVTVNVAKIDAYGLAIQNGADALLANPLISGALGPQTSIAIAAALASAAAAINAINTSAKGSQTFTFNSASVPTALVSLQADAVTIFNTFKTGLAAAGQSLPANVLSVFDALQTVVALLLALIPTVGAPKASALPRMTMAENQALTILHAN